jgi:hypothetical protein
MFLEAPRTPGLYEAASMNTRAQFANYFTTGIDLLAESGNFDLFP